MADLARLGACGSEARVSACLERIAAREPEARAFVHLDPGQATAQALAADRAPRVGRGHLRGVPVAIKEAFDVARDALSLGYGDPRRACPDNRFSGDEEAARGRRGDGSATGSPMLQGLWTLAGLAVLALPRGLFDGLPIGAQLAAAPGREDLLVAAAGLTESAV